MRKINDIISYVDAQSFKQICGALARPSRDLGEFSGWF